MQRVLEEGLVVVTTGKGYGVSVEHEAFRLAFNDLFTFRNRLIARVDPYIVWLSEPAIAVIPGRITALHNAGGSRGLNPPVSSSDLAM